ncbi:MAG: cohesin domain-containing protein [Oscillospiraceae bacterium]|nr:cohesin domain-containing protein [Oscillospiraceae bacterium]
MKKQLLPELFQRLLSCVLVFFMAAAFLPGLAAPAFAAAEIPSFYLTPVTCKPGEEVIVFLRIYNAVGLLSGNGEIKYDSKMLEFVSFEEPEEATDAGVMIEGGNISAAVSFAFVHTGETGAKTAEFNLAKIVFRAKSEGKSKLTLDMTDLRTSAQDASIDSKIKKASATVTVGADVDSEHLAGENGSDFDWAGVSDPATAQENSNYGRVMLIACIIVVAAVGIVVVVAVLTRKKTDVNPNKIDVKKE